MLLAPLVLIHLGLIIVAVRNGLTGAEILSRTQGNLIWALFYGGFVICASIHAPIGIRNLLREWTPLGAAPVNIFAALFSLVLLLLGLRAVIAVFHG